MAIQARATQILETDMMHLYFRVSGPMLLATLPLPGNTDHPPARMRTILSDSAWSVPTRGRSRRPVRGDVIAGASLSSIGADRAAPERVQTGRPAHTATVVRGGDRVDVVHEGTTDPIG